MKTKHLFASFVIVCAVAGLAGCASTNCHVSESSFFEPNLSAAPAPVSPARPPDAVLDERVFRNLDLNADGTITLEEWQHFDPSAGAKENFNALDENGDGQINVTEFLTQGPKHSERYHFLGDTDKTDDGYVSSDTEVFRQPGWHLFSFHF